MSKFEKGNKKGVQFGSGQDTRKGGRPKLMITKYKEIGYSKDDVRNTYSAISALNSKELDNLIDNPEGTVLEKAIAKTFLTAINNGDYRFIKDVVELFADKATQHSVTKLETIVKYDSKSDEELEALLKKKLQFSES